MSNKFRARRHKYDDKVFASGRELRRYKELLLLQQTGEISELETQPRYTIIPKMLKPNGKVERAAVYTADFRYIENGAVVVEDVKSAVTAKLADYVLRRKLMLYVHGIEVREVL